MIPGPAERLACRLEDIPDACRSVLAAWDRHATKGGGKVSLTLDVGADGRLRGIELEVRFEPGGAVLGA